VNGAKLMPQSGYTHGWISFIVGEENKFKIGFVSVV